MITKAGITPEIPGQVIDQPRGQRLAGSRFDNASKLIAREIATALQQLFKVLQRVAAARSCGFRGLRTGIPIDCGQ
jgi:hypothetical protein